MAGTTVSHEQVDKAAKHAISAGETITLNLGRLLNEIQSSAAAFQGLAGSAFQNTSQELGNELSKMLQALNGLADNVLGANAAYANTDEAARSEISSVLGAHLPGATPVTDALRG